MIFEDKILNDEFGKEYYKKFKNTRLVLKVMGEIRKFIPRAENIAF